MASEEVLVPTPAIPGTPSTPVPQHSQLPKDQAGSPGLEPPSSPRSDRVTRPLRDTRLEAAKYVSPPTQSSITPPPSTQTRPKMSSPFSPTNDRVPVAVGTTPMPMKSLLSSPPPTMLKQGSPLAEARFESLFRVPSGEEIASASAEQLRSLVESSSREISSLRISLQEARTSAAHHKLQYNLLSIETEEAMKRMHVEHDMSRREVEALQKMDHLPLHTSFRPALESSVLQSRDNANLEKVTLTLKHENDSLQKRLWKAKKLVLHRDGEVAAYRDENARLRQRIQKNREHLGRFRQPGGLFDSSPRPLDASPSQQTQADDSIGAILLADQVLNSGGATAPSTPVRKPRAKDVRRGHQRGAYSLSSLPSTPLQKRALSSIRYPESPTPQEPPRGRSPSQSAQADSPETRRRKSRDSTISVSEDEMQPQRTAESREYGRVNESPASQLATSMLRHSAQSPKTPKERSGESIQTKISGHLEKPGSQRVIHYGLGKRPTESRDEDSRKGSIKGHQQKKYQTEAGVGLGIDPWTRSQS